MTNSRTWGVVGIACLAGALLIGTVAAQEGSGARVYPMLLSNVSLPAIDRGIREFDPPRPPRSQRTAQITRGTPGTAPFLRGSIIVKFRAGTAPTAPTRRVNPSLTDASVSTVPARVNAEP